MDLNKDSDHHLEDDLTSQKKNQNEVAITTYPKRPYPVKVFSIIAMEFCERFAFYGLRTILVLYLRNVLGFSDSSATITFHIFACLCYFTPLFGAILADVFLDKYKTILYLSMIHLLGDFTLIFSAIIWNYQRIPIVLAFVGLFMISIGAGGIKPCVSALGGDQFTDDEQKWRNQFFPIFFLSIELGWIVSVFTVPILRTTLQCVGRSDCYPAAFGAPSTLMLIAIICFVLARKKYHLSPKPDKSIIVMFFECLWLASKRRVYIFFENFKSKFTFKSSSRKRSLKGVVVDRLKNTEHWLYLASDKFDKKSISNFVSLLGLITLLLPIQLHYCLLDQQASLWTLQANRMDGRILNTNFIFDPDQIGLVSPLITILAIPVLELGIYPCFARFGVETSPLQRMTIGGLFTSFSYISSALIENRIDNFLPKSEPPLGKTNLLLINGLRHCFIESPTITYMQKAKYMVSNSSISRIGGAKRVSRAYDNLEPTGVRSIDLLSSNSSLISYYRFSFELRDYVNDSSGIGKQKCSYINNTIQNFNFRPLADKRVKLLYLKDDDQKLGLLMFNDSLELPLAGRARVRLLYDEAYNNEVSAEEERQFLLVHKASASHPQASRFQFKWLNKQQQVLLSNYIDVDVPTRGEKFSLQTDDKLLSFVHDNDEAIHLKPGTRNLIIIQQIDNSTKLEIEHKLLQDNNYRISMLYQLFPYTFISLGNVMLSMTGLSFCYSSAPNGMQPVILGVFYSMNGFGNLLTVIVDTLFTFENEANRFIFFAAFMALAMILFSYLGYKFEPRKP